MKKTESIIIKFIFYILSLASLAYVVYNLIFASYVANYILSRALPGAIIFLASSISCCILLVNEKNR